MGDFSEYVVYVDESGDHGLEKIDPDYPVFVLAFCIFTKLEYLSEVVPALQRLKFDYFGHDMVVLHERDIRKQTGHFRILSDRAVETRFVSDLTELMRAARFTVIASVIQKERLRKAYSIPDSPYDLALAFCLERLFLYLQDRSKHESKLHVVFEQRGKREDESLELHFRRVCAGQNRLRRQSPLPFEPIFAAKAVNCSGLQVADLVARPIGIHVLRPGQRNRAYDVIETKLRKSHGGKIQGYGLKTFP